RHPDQLWTLYNLEPPPNIILMSESHPNILFNLTASYRTDSDVVTPYGRVHRRDVPLKAFDPRLNFDLRFKTKPIAWFVSRCHTQSHREDYVQELSKFV